MGLLRSWSRQPAIAAAIAAGLVVAACSSGPSGSNTSTGGTEATSGTSSSTSATARATATYAPARATVTGKSTDVAVNPAVAAALKQVDIAVTAIAPATARTALLFPVSGGQIAVATFAGTIDHTGGLSFSRRGKRVAFTRLVINTNTKRLTATFGGQPMPVFDLNLASSARVRGSHGTVVMRNIKLEVTAQTAATLNSSLGVSTFRAGMKFGIATITVVYAQGHR